MRITFGGSEAPTTRVGGPQLAASKQTATKAMTAKHVAWRIRRRGLGRLLVACAIGKRLYSGQLVDGPLTPHLGEREVPEKRSSNTRRSFDIKATTATFPVDPAVPFGPDADYYYDPEIKRRADVYVFAYYAERDPARYDSLDVRGWCFYVLSTPELERHFGTQGRVALSRVQAVTAEVGYGDLKTAVDAARGMSLASA